MESEIKVSIVVPAYNVENFISQTIRSIARQNFGSFEIIVVNDGSTDASEKEAEAELKKAGVPYAIISQENKGLAEARNAGLRAARGEFVAFIDSDDTIAENFVPALREIALANNSDIVSCEVGRPKDSDMDVFKSAEGEVCAYRQMEFFDLFLKRKVPFLVPASLFRRDFLLKNGLFFDKTIRYSEDICFLWDAILSGAKIAHTTAKLYNYRARANSIMSSASMPHILTSLNGYKSMIARHAGLEREFRISNIYAKHVFAVLHSAAKILDFGGYKKLVEECGAKKMSAEFLRFPDARVKLLSVLLFANLRLFYTVMRKF